MSVFDKLEGKMPPQDAGRRLAAMRDLPPGHRKIMRILLREGEAMKYDAIWEMVQAMPDEERMSPDDLDDALSALTQDGWLIRMGEGTEVAYEANLGYKPPSTLSKAIWSTLGSKIQQSKSLRESEDDSSPS